jgi:glycosyltransferase involved in cell wall biosynthesis
MPIVSIVIPVFNEKQTITELIRHVEQAPLPKGFRREIILVDDFSTDGTREILKKIKRHQVFFHEKNQGKGAALRTGFQKARGDILIVQDADFEYDPQEYPVLLAPIISKKADAVFGSRFLGGAPHRVLFFWHYVGNRALTMFSNMLTNLNLTDMETCYKVFTREVRDYLLPRLKSDRFGFEPEFTARVARGGFRIYEVGISYSGRTYAEGKKISWRDGVAALWHVIYFNLIAE